MEMLIQSLTLPAVIVLALALGAGFSFSLLRQFGLQREAILRLNNANRSRLSSRITQAGLSFALLLAVVLCAKWSIIGRVPFILTASAAAIFILIFRRLFVKGQRNVS
jgi:hypothetical protein